MRKTNKSLITRKLRAWFDLASADQAARGKLWYHEAHGFACTLADQTGIPLERVCGVIAVLSPAVYWRLNKKQAEELCNAHAEGLDIRSIVLSTYGGQAEKAYAILESQYDLSADDVARMLGGGWAMKTKAFFRNILDPIGSLSVTVDRHIVTAAGYTRTHPALYRAMARTIARMAAEHGLRPCQVQAIVWTCYKETTGAYSNAEGSVDIPEVE